MRELTQIRTAVQQALQNAGVTALAAFPAERAKAYSGPVAAVSVGAAEGKVLGFCNYLGEERDEQSGVIRERYGKLLEAEICVNIRGESAAVCDSGCETASGVLLGGLPEGIRPGELSWEALCWERETGLFLRRGRLRCQAVFQALAQEEGAAFLDFILKGVLQS